MQIFLFSKIKFYLKIDSQVNWLGIFGKLKCCRIYYIYIYGTLYIWNILEKFVQRTNEIFNRHLNVSFTYRKYSKYFRVFLECFFEILGTFQEYLAFAGYIVTLRERERKTKFVFVNINKKIYVMNKQNHSINRLL